MDGRAWSRTTESRPRLPGSREIAPIVQARCLSWSYRSRGARRCTLATFEAAKPGPARFVRRCSAARCRNGARPRGYGEFLNDPSLSPLSRFSSSSRGWTAARRRPCRGRCGPRSLLLVLIRPKRSAGVAGSTRSAARARRLPVGRLVGVRPRLDAGGSVRVTAFSRTAGARSSDGFARVRSRNSTTSYYSRDAVDAAAQGRGLVTEVGGSQTCSLTLSIG
jgi:hypothetical protein